MNIGQKIKDARSSKGVSRRELGERMGVGYRQVWFWETKDSNITISTLEKIAQALDIKVAVLFVGKEEVL